MVEGDSRRDDEGPGEIQTSGGFRGRAGLDSYERRQIQDRVYWWWRSHTQEQILKILEEYKQKGV